MGTNPATMREAILADLLGEMGVLVEKVEALEASLPVTIEQGIAKVRAAGELASGSVTAAGERFLGAFGESTKEPLQEIKRAAMETRKAAEVVDKAAWRYAVLTAVLALGAGVLGGVLGALIISNQLFGN